MLIFFGSEGKRCYEKDNSLLTTASFVGSELVAWVKSIWPMICNFPGALLSKSFGLILPTTLTPMKSKKAFAFLYVRCRLLVNLITSTSYPSTTQGKKRLTVPYSCIWSCHF